MLAALSCEPGHDRHEARRSKVCHRLFYKATGKNATCIYVVHLVTIALVSTEPTAATRAYDLVKEMILTTEIPGGELISEGDIARLCACSRTPVREAFLRLEAEGWMRLYPKRGALVLPVTEREAGDVLQARLLLEGHAVARIVARPAVHAILIDDLRANLAEHRSVAPTDIASFSRVDAQFHQLIVAAGDNPLIAGFFASLGERHRRMTTASVQRDPGVTTRIIDEHAAIIDAIASGEPSAFDAALAAHLASVHQPQAHAPGTHPAGTYTQGNR